MGHDARAVGSRAAVLHHSLWSPLDRIVIEAVYPELDGGRYPVKRLVGESVDVFADIFRDGHDVIRAAILWRAEDEADWREAPMHFVDNDRWGGSFRPTRNARHLFTIEAWTDVFASWCQDAVKKHDAGQDITGDLLEGRALAAALEQTEGDDGATVRNALAAFDAAGDQAGRLAALLQDAMTAAMLRVGARADGTRYRRELAVTVDRRRAVYGAWYEMFPRSQGSMADNGADFDACIARLPAVAAMGFDVIYLVPIHPIGRRNRKGADNSLNAGPDDPGSPYAIGAAEGGHDAVHPELGTLEDFRRFVAACRQHDMEVALDFAVQCAPDHPWISEHPDWFAFRPDGSIKYAENPPKKYEDIVLPQFYGPHREALWQELRRLVLFWIEQGVRIFRVDNPHTKPVVFWEWLIREVQALHPDVLFLAEAFTRPKLLRALAKAGFTQSYTYFTWRNFKAELTDYLTELVESTSREYLRPNFFPNTPDILPAILQKGGRPAFQMRLVLAATLSATYGIYNGFELCENAAVPDSEEYLHSEKYQYKVWDWERPGNIVDYVRQMNMIRRDNPALQQMLNLRFYHADNDNILFYGKIDIATGNAIFVAINLDPFEAHESALHFPLVELGVGEADAFEAEELFAGERHLWHGPVQQVRLDPQRNPAAIFRLSIWKHVEFRAPVR